MKSRNAAKGVVAQLKALEPLFFVEETHAAMNGWSGIFEGITPHTARLAY
jgi:hypothetical protein